MSTNAVGDYKKPFSLIRRRPALALLSACLAMAISTSCSQQPKTAESEAKEAAEKAEKAVPALPAGAMTLSAVLKATETAGYSPVVEVELEKDYWKVKAYSNGQLLQLKVDPVKGSVMPNPAPKVDKSLSEIVKSLEDQGYGPIVDIERAGEEGGAPWEIEAYKGKSEVKLHVDPATGAITAK